MTVVSRRTRDPARKEKILRAAADLVARNGFHSVSMAEIGGEAGITGSGIYRHFDGKSSILVALFDQVIDDLLGQEREILDRAGDSEAALAELVAGQVDFAVGQRQLAQVYYHEIRNLPEDDQTRLRGKQRLYLREWARIVAVIHPDLSGAEARAVVHAAIGAIQSTLFHSAGLPGDRMRAVLFRAAMSVLSPERKPDPEPAS